jgi:hypothetical protein
MGQKTNINSNNNFILKTYVISCLNTECPKKFNIPYYNVYTSFWDTLYLSERGMCIKWKPL